MTGLYIERLRNLRPPLVAVAMMAPAALLVLYLWHSTPSAAPEHAMHLQSGGAWTRLVVFLTAWMLMTAGMMLPSAMPLLTSLDRIARNHARRHEIPVFATLAYLGIWGIVGLAAWVVSSASEAYIVPNVDSRTVSWLAGGGLILAGAYGLSPLASACLRACRRPFGFLARYWRGGSAVRLQAARIGAAYGISCVGCCVPMIGLMFVVGMANIAIVISMGVLMVLMKTSATGTRVARLLAYVLIGAGAAISFAWLPLSPHQH